MFGRAKILRTLGCFCRGVTVTAALWMSVVPLVIPLQMSMTTISHAQANVIFPSNLSVAQLVQNIARDGNGNALEITNVIDGPNGFRVVQFISIANGQIVSQVESNTPNIGGGGNTGNQGNAGNTGGTNGTDAAAAIDGAIPVIVEEVIDGDVAKTFGINFSDILFGAAADVQELRDRARANNPPLIEVVPTDGNQPAAQPQIAPNVEEETSSIQTEDSRANLRKALGNLINERAELRRNGQGDSDEAQEIQSQINEILGELDPDGPFGRPTQEEDERSARTQEEQGFVESDECKKCRLEARSLQEQVWQANDQINELIKQRAVLGDLPIPGRLVRQLNIGPLPDDELQEFLPLQGNVGGFTEEQIVDLAKQGGLSESEIQTLKDQIDDQVIADAKAQDKASLDRIKKQLVDDAEREQDHLKKRNEITAEITKIREKNPAFHNIKDDGTSIPISDTIREIDTLARSTNVRLNRNAPFNKSRPPIIGVFGVITLGVAKVDDLLELVEESDQISDNDKNKIRFLAGRLNLLRDLESLDRKRNNIDKRIADIRTLRKELEDEKKLFETTAFNVQKFIENVLAIEVFEAIDKIKTENFKNRVDQELTRTRRLKDELQSKYEAKLKKIHEDCPEENAFFENGHSSVGQTLIASVDTSHKKAFHRVNRPSNYLGKLRQEARTRPLAFAASTENNKKPSRSIDNITQPPVRQGFALQGNDHQLNARFDLREWRQKQKRLYGQRVSLGERANPGEEDGRPLIDLPGILGDKRFNLFGASSITIGRNNDGGLGQDSLSYAVSGGFSWLAHPKLNIGLAGRYSDGDIDSTVAAIDTATWGIAAFAQTQVELGEQKINLEGIAAYSRSDIDSLFNTAGVITTTDDVNLTAFSSQIKASTSFKLDEFLVSPFASLSYIATDREAFTLSDGQFQNGVNNEQVTFSAGSSLSTSFLVPDTEITLSPNLGFGVFGTVTDGSDVGLSVNGGLGIKTRRGISGSLGVGFSGFTGNTSNLSFSGNISIPLN